MSHEKRRLDTIEVHVPRDLHDFRYVRVNGRSFTDIEGLYARKGRKPVATVPLQLVGDKGALLASFASRSPDNVRVELFICTCGVWGCWSYAVYIRRSRRFVYWSLDGGGSFVFGRKLYEAAFAKAFS